MGVYEVIVSVKTERTVVVAGNATIKDNEHQGNYYSDAEMKAMVEACSLVGGQLDDAEILNIKTIKGED
jgi:hypothetical protein